jgi:anti-sigma factor RsiW
MRVLPSRFRGRQPLTCGELVELVTAYVEETLDARERKRFEWHIGRCDACTHYVEQLRTTIMLTGRLEPEELSDNARDELLHAFREWKRANG